MSDTFIVKNSFGDTLFEGDRTELEKFTLYQITLLSIDKLSEMKWIFSNRPLYKLAKCSAVRILLELNLIVEHNGKNVRE